MGVEGGDVNGMGISFALTVKLSIGLIVYSFSIVCRDISSKKTARKGAKTRREELVWVLMSHPIKNGLREQAAKLCGRGDSNSHASYGATTSK